MSFGTTILRLTVGGLFVGHGLQKLNGSFGGPGLDGVEQMMAGTGMHPPRRNAVLVSITETAGGAAIALGAATPLAAAGLVATMVTAVRKVHWSNGVWNSDGGFEYNAVLAAAVAAIAGGPGKASIDAAFGKKKWGVGGTLFALGAGVAGSLIAVELGKRSAPEASPAVESASAADAETPVESTEGTTNGSADEISPSPDAPVTTDDSSS